MKARWFYYVGYLFFLNIIGAFVFSESPFLFTTFGVLYAIGGSVYTYLEEKERNSQKLKDSKKEMPKSDRLNQIISFCNLIEVLNAEIYDYSVKTNRKMSDCMSDVSIRLNEISKELYEFESRCDKE